MVYLDWPNSFTYHYNNAELNSATGQTVNSSFDESGFINGVATKGCPQK